MEINEKKFKENLIKHKKKIARAGFTFLEQPTKEEAQTKKISNKFNVLKRGASELALVRADFKCENPACRKEEKLQFHHLLMRKAKEFMPFNLYLTQRHYWSSIIVLCESCHRKYHHDVEGLSEMEMGFIKQKTIDRIKRKYQVK